MEDVPSIGCALLSIPYQVTVLLTKDAEHNHCGMHEVLVTILLTILKEVGLWKKAIPYHTIPYYDKKHVSQ